MTLISSSEGYGHAYLLCVDSSVEIVTGIPAHTGIVYYCILLCLYYLLFIDNY